MECCHPVPCNAASPHWACASPSVAPCTPPTLYVWPLGPSHPPPLPVKPHAPPTPSCSSPQCRQLPGKGGWGVCMQQQPPTPSAPCCCQSMSSCMQYHPPRPVPSLPLCPSPPPFCQLLLKCSMGGFIVFVIHSFLVPVDACFSFFSSL